MLLHLLFIFQLIKFVQTDNLMGGSINFSPSMSSSGGSSTIKLTIVQTYMWKYTRKSCKSSQQSIKLDHIYELVCLSSPATSIIPKSIPISKMSCVDTSDSSDVSITQTIMSLRVLQNTQFNCSFKNSARSLLLKVTQSNRSDGTINSSPQVALVSPVVIIANNQPQIISIPVIDQDNDTVQCRFANTSAECGDACMLNSWLKNFTLLNNCTLIIQKYPTNGWYPISIQVEDFFPGNNTPLSSIPFQFLINIRPSPSSSCKEPPTLNSNISPFIQNVTINVPFLFQLNTNTTCPFNIVSVKNILSFALLSIIKSSLVRTSKYQQKWTMNVWWTPTSQQIGSQLLCMVAVDSRRLQSKQLCQRFMVNLPTISGSNSTSSSYNPATTLVATYPIPFSSYVKSFGNDSMISFDQLNQSMTLDLIHNTVSIFGLYFNSTTSGLVNINVTSNDNIVQQFVNLSIIYVNFSSCQLINSITFQSTNKELLKNISHDIQLIFCHISTTCNYTTENDIMDQDTFLESFYVDNDTISVDQLIDTLNEDFSFESNALNYSIDIYFYQSQVFLLENLTVVMLDDTNIDSMTVHYILPDRSIVKSHFLPMLNSSSTSPLTANFTCISLSELSGIRIIFGPTDDNSTLDHLALSIYVRNCSYPSYNYSKLSDNLLNATFVFYSGMLGGNIKNLTFPSSYYISSYTIECNSSNNDTRFSIIMSNGTIGYPFTVTNTNNVVKNFTWNSSSSVWAFGLSVHLFAQGNISCSSIWVTYLDCSQCNDAIDIMSNDLNIVQNITTIPKIKTPLSFMINRNEEGMNFSTLSPTIKLRFQYPISIDTLGNPNTYILSTIRLDPDYETNVKNISVQFLLKDNSIVFGTNGSVLTYISQPNNTIIISSQNNITISGLLINLITSIGIPYNVKLQVFVRDCTNNQDWLPDWITDNDIESITTEVSTSISSSDFSVSTSSTNNNNNNILFDPCIILQPCQNNRTCHNDNQSILGYFCDCGADFNGHDCEIDIRLCKPTTCWHNGTCVNTSATEFHCDCMDGWCGKNCELLIDFCQNVICLNGGVCRKYWLNFTCECTSNYFGRYCEREFHNNIIRRYVSKSFGIIAITILASTVGFVLFMDILKYIFNIDPVQTERDRINRYKAQKQKKKLKTIYRYRYIP